MRQVRFLLNTYLTTPTIVVQSGASRKDHQNKEGHMTTKRMNSDEKKRQSAVQSPEKDYFPISNRRSSRIITSYV